MSAATISAASRRSWPDASGAGSPTLSGRNVRQRTDHPLTQSGIRTRCGVPASLGGGLERAVDLDHPGRSCRAEEAIARRYVVSRERVIVTVGATGGIFLAARSVPRRHARRRRRALVEPFRSLPCFFSSRRSPDPRSAAPRTAGRSIPPAVRKSLARGTGRPRVSFVHPHSDVLAARRAHDDRDRLRSNARAGGLLVRATSNVLTCRRDSLRVVFAARRML